MARWNVFSSSWTLVPDAYDTPGPKAPQGAGLAPACMTQLQVLRQNRVQWSALPTLYYVRCLLSRTSRVVEPQTTYPFQMTPAFIQYVLSAGFLRRPQILNSVFTSVPSLRGRCRSTVTHKCLSQCSVVISSIEPISIP